MKGRMELVSAALTTLESIRTQLVADDLEVLVFNVSQGETAHIDPQTMNVKHEPDGTLEVTLRVRQK